jgi:hypothetical protein
LTQSAPPATRSSVLLWGLVLAGGGFAVTALNWYAALNEGSYYITASIMGPVICSLGLAMLVAPAASGEKPGALYTARRYGAIALIGLGIAAGFASIAAFNGWIAMP